MAHLAGCQYSVIDVSQSLGVTTVARFSTARRAACVLCVMWTKSGAPSLVDIMVNIYLMAKMRCFFVSS